MKQIKKYFTVKWCAMISALLGMLGFAACGSKDDDNNVATPNPNPDDGEHYIESPCLYGQPYAQFKVEGAVFNEEGLTVEGVKVYVRDNYGDTTRTDQDGKFVFNTQDIWAEHEFWVMAEDPSGVYAADSVSVIPRFESGNGDWFRGSYSTTHDFTLKKKPADSETPEQPSDPESPEQPSEPETETSK